MQLHLNTEVFRCFVWYLDNFLEKDKTGLSLQINIA